MYQHVRYVPNHIFAQQKVRKAAPRYGIDITKSIRFNRQIVVVQFIALVRSVYHTSCLHLMHIL
jgi:hypothetical protein